MRREKFSFISSVVAFLVGVALIGSAMGQDVRLNKHNHFKADQTFKKDVTVKGRLSVEGGLSATEYSKAFYVDSGSGQDTLGNGYGLTWEKPFDTIEYAQNQCVANRGDIIYVLPGHALAVSAAAGLDLDVAGITIVGLGSGSLQPTITLDTANTADIDIDAANITIVGMHFRANYVDIAAAIDVNADDFSLIGCRFSAVATDMNAKIWVQDAAATASDRITIENCVVRVVDAANTHFVNFAGTGDGHRIIGNELTGDWGTMCIGGAGVVTRVTIADNIISNAASDNDSCINLEATVTGIVVRNLCASAALQANGITATACTIAENYYGVVGEDLSAILEPAGT